VNDIYGTVRLQGAGSKIVFAGESKAVFHDPVTNNGGVIEVFPGSRPIYLQGLTTMGSGSVLSIHLADPADGPDFGQVEVAGSAALAGNLEVKLAAGFTPSAGDAFQILTSAGGITGTLNLSGTPALPTGMQWDLDILPNAVVLRVIGTGDYNGNGMVDAADYAVWRNLLGQSGPGLAADGDGNGIVDTADYNFWRSRFGNLVPGAASVAVVSTPEPSIWFLLAAGCVGMSHNRRNGRRRTALQMRHFS
jgi:hypothetical protein